MTELARWSDFYVVVGSSAGALIGLQFVVMTLIAGAPVSRTDSAAASAFSTPSVVHFGAVLGLSATLSAPWDHISAAAVAWGLTGVAGIVYSAFVFHRFRTQTIYVPVLEDWAFHAVLAPVAYAALAASAFFADAHAHGALFCVGGALVLLLFIGVHNAWDTVLFHVVSRRGGDASSSEVDADGTGTRST